MAQPVTPQDHIRVAAQRIRDVHAAAKRVAQDLADERAAATTPNQVEPPSPARG